MSNVWVEKYRPSRFDHIVLDPLNKQILQNIIETGYFPNLLFYGPPGTGKTTTIINLVKEYQTKINDRPNNKELVIHLNASDERGIDIIRIQINQFVNSNAIFQNGMKFVILDEVDYMTKSAQQALRYLLVQNAKTRSVRFCLICNYLSRIDEGLQNEFMKLRFNQLPEEDIIRVLQTISVQEQMQIDHSALQLIQKLYKSDVRSMINFMQSNQHILNGDFHILDETVWVQILAKLRKGDSLETIYSFIADISKQYNMDKKNVIKYFTNYLLRTEPSLNHPTFLRMVENIVHYENCKSDYYVNSFLTHLQSLLLNLAISPSTAEPHSL